MSKIDSRHVQYILCCLTGQNEKKNSNQHEHSPGIEVIRLWQNLPDHMHRRLNKQCKNPCSSQSVLFVTLSYYGYCYLYSIDLLRKHSSNGKYVHAFQQYQIRSQHNQCTIASRIVNSLWDKTKHNQILSYQVQKQCFSARRAKKGVKNILWYTASQ